MDNTLSWNDHIDLLVKKLSTACYIIRNATTFLHVCLVIKHYLLRIFSFVRELWNYILWELFVQFCNFQITKKSIRVMEGCGNRVLCRSLCKKLEILPLTSQFDMLSLLLFVVQNKNFYLTNNEDHNMDRQTLDKGIICTFLKQI